MGHENELRCLIRDAVIDDFQDIQDDAVHGFFAGLDLTVLDLVDPELGDFSEDPDEEVAYFVS